MEEEESETENGIAVNTLTGNLLLTVLRTTGAGKRTGRKQGEEEELETENGIAMKRLT